MDTPQMINTKEETSMGCANSAPSVEPTPADGSSPTPQQHNGGNAAQTAPAEQHHISYEALSREDDVASALAVDFLAKDPNFEKLAVSEGHSIQKRDAEDEVKLSVGVKHSIDKGVISADHGASAPIQINVVGKSADEVAAEILNRLQSGSDEKGNGHQEGSVIILVGLSGTGKGTTVAKLSKKLPKVITWSNGNAFRALTHLIAQDCGKELLTAEDVTADRVKSAVEKLSFEKFTDEKDGSDTFDVVIDKDTRVSQIQNTLLKAPIISRNVPTVAEQTQGEVILFARGAVETLKQNGYNVILEGRAQTLNYIPTEYRFELVMSETKLLGQRRAAQRVVAHAVNHLKHKPEAERQPNDVEAALTEAAKELSSA